MARLEDFGLKPKSNEVSELKTRVLRKYGENLGGVLYDYAFEQPPHTFEEVAERRLKFAQQVVTILETGTHDEKVMGISALLTSFEAKLSPVAQTAANADSRTRPIG